MMLLRESQRYIARANYQERHVLKRNGFRWCPQEKVWWTNNEAFALDVQECTGCDILDQTPEEGLNVPSSYEGHPSCVTDGPDDIPIPPCLEYRPFQKGGIAFARGKEGVLVADEMGLGKTIQAIGMMNDEPIRTALIICPASLKLNWELEIDKWLNYHRMVEIVGPVWNQNRHIYIINYDILKKHKAKIDSIHWDMLVCDESQYLKSPDAKRTQMVLGDGRLLQPIKAKRRVFLSGTPIENRPSELFPVIHSLCPSVFSSWTDYALRYCAGFMGPWGLDTRGASNLAELQFKLRESCMVRRMKKDVLTDLPPKQYQEMVFPCNGKARTAVDNEMREYNRSKKNLAELGAKSDLSTIEGREAYHQAEAHLRMNLNLARKKTTETLLPMALDYLDTALGSGKVIVFCYHKYVMREIAKRFGKLAVTVSGETPNNLRQVAVERFQGDDDVQLFIGQIKAAGVGLTLTASSHVVFVERDFVPGRISQAEDRAHRMGQKNSVLITHCVLEDSYDQEMLETLARKRGTVNQAMNT